MLADSFSEQDAQAMQLAIEQAKLALAHEEIPVGAVVLDAEGRVLGVGHNRTIIDHDPTAHAEVIALREAAGVKNNYRLPGLRLFVTLEPCIMCMGALMHARLAQVVYGARDPKTGACGSVLDIASYHQLNHHTQVRAGLLADDCSALLSDFFRQRRARLRAIRQHTRSR